MKTLLLLCAGLLFLGLVNLPIGYYTLLRIAVTIASVAVVLKEFEKGINAWVITFGLIAILFNPIIPIYLYSKSLWIPIDLTVGVLFVIKSFTLKQN